MKDRKIQMVDLKRQYLGIKTEIDEAIQNVVESTQFINGPAVSEFKSNLEKYLEVKNVIPCANGTDALQIAMMALNLKPGDEVITASFTYVATAEVIALLKLTPVLVEINPETFTIDPRAVEKAITPNTKAIVPVHLYGQCADMESIMKIAEKYNLYVIEDVAQAIGSTFTFSDGRAAKAGTIGTIGCTSFFPSKNLGCYGDGGALYTNDDDLAKRIKMIANHGQSVQYIHDEVGVNSRLDTIQAAILNVKLKHLDAYAQARNIAAHFYDKAFHDQPMIKTPVRFNQSTHVFHQYTITLNNADRDSVRKDLAEKGIPTMIYYPKPLHHQRAYANSKYHDEDFPYTVDLCKRVLSLPMHTELGIEELEYISQEVINSVNKYNLYK
ncbi:MAG: DegT/DnrJ/EryC1/StrS family aminotransferase [Bacteroidota bacterium]|jgi:UDP-2-acetamido-2-deoxy-ribo-hexuluronate aminotransferase